MCSTGSFGETCISTLHVKTWTHVPARPQAHHTRITAIQGVTTPSQGSYRLSHALTGAGTYRMTPCPHGATDIQNVTTPSQHHSLTWRHRVLIKSQLYKMSLSPHRAMVLQGVTMAWQGNSPPRCLRRRVDLISQTGHHSRRSEKDNEAVKE